MKKIFNWRKATVFDIEADSLLEDATKIHVLAYKLLGKDVGEIEGTNSERLVKFFKYHIDNNIPVVAHNGICYDVPLVEKLLEVDLSKLMVIDTLGLSWYLNTTRQRHGLDSFLEDYGIEKPKIDDWENLTYEEYANRCREDVKINTALWEDFMDRLYDMYSKAKQAIDSGKADGTRVSPDEICYIDQYKNTSSVDEYIERILTFLCHKVDIIRLKEKTRFKLDEEAVNESISKLEALITSATQELESVMPQVPKYVKKEAPKKPFKKNGELSASGLTWEDHKSKVGVIDEMGNVLAEWVDASTLKVLSKYEPPNINGHQQIKDFLFSKGWKPESFKFDIDEEARQVWVNSGYRKDLKPIPRKIPQINVEGENGKELCPSVVRLAEEVPEIMAYAKYSVIKHRYGILTGFKRDAVKGYLKASCGGFTNTLREQHRELVNLPAASRPYGEMIRGALIADKGCVLCGSDMSSLEDRVKHHFMIPHDPEYVATMTTKGYDPHLELAVLAGFMSPEDRDLYKQLKSLGDNKTEEQSVVFEKLGKLRQTGKSGNYACQYGSGADTLARTAKVTLDVAKKVVEGYAKLNWSIQAIADEQCVIVDSLGAKWLVNPVNGLLYSIRSDKDRFSTLCQGTGSYFFDIWVDKYLDKMQAKWGVKKLSLTAHDEEVTNFRDTEENKRLVEVFLREAVEEVNVEYKLRRKLDVDVQFGYKYSEIH